MEWVRMFGREGSVTEGFDEGEFGLGSSVELLGFRDFGDLVFYGGGRWIKVLGSGWGVSKV